MWDSSTRGVGDGGGPVPRDLGGQILWVSGWLNFIINAVLMLCPEIGPQLLIKVQ